MRVAHAWTLALVAAAIGLHGSRVAAQTEAVRPAGDASAELSTDSVAMAEVFELRVRVSVPVGSAVFFSDTIRASSDLESFAPVEWSAERGPDDAVLTLTYPLIAFSSGNISVPGPDIVIGPAELAAEGEGVPGGSRVGAWENAPRGTEASLRRSRLPDGVIWVHSVQSSQDTSEGVGPRGPDDVVGSSWSWPTVTLLALFSSTLVGAGVTTTREWLGRRALVVTTQAPASRTAEAARLAALADIERLLAAGPHAGERVPAVYEESSDIMRVYAERLDPSWGPDLTSTELMGRLRAGAGGSDALAEAMRVAEAVKFGRLRPPSSAVESHLMTLRAWLAEERVAA